MALNGVLSLVWTPLLLRALGAEAYGTYTAFGALVGLATAGELGLGGATAMRTNQLVAVNDVEGLKRLHSTARGVFVTLAVLAMAVALSLSPWLPGWLGFQPSAATGSLTWLFAAGALNVGLALLSSYVASSLYGVGTVMWPIVPTFLFGQATLILSVVLAWLEQPLWILQGVTGLLAAASLGVMWFLYKRSHPVFGEAIPWQINRVLLRELARTSIWTYLCGLTNLVYVATDRLVVNAFFGARAVSGYQLNYKLCELALALVITAGSVALPKVVNLLLSPEAGVGARGAAQLTRLAQVQGLLAFTASVAYLAVNDRFIALLFGPEYNASLVLQGAFAVTLLITGNSDIFVQISARLAVEGFRFATKVLIVFALVNLGLSLTAAAGGWMPGVAWATFVAQLGSFFVIAEYVRRRDRLGTRGLILWRSLVAPLLFLGVAFAAKTALPPDSWTGGAALAAVFALLLAAYCRVVGPRWSELAGELAIVRRLFKPAG